MASLRRYDGEKEKNTHFIRLYDELLFEKRRKDKGIWDHFKVGCRISPEIECQCHTFITRPRLYRWMVGHNYSKKTFEQKKNKRGTKLEMDVAIHTLTIQKAEEIRPKQFSQSAAVIDSKVHFTASSRNQPRS